MSEGGGRLYPVSSAFLNAVNGNVKPWTIWLIYNTWFLTKPEFNYLLSCVKNLLAFGIRVASFHNLDVLEEVIPRSIV